MRGPRGFWNNGMLSWLTASNFPLHLTAARLRFGIKPNGYGWAAAGDRRVLDGTRERKYGYHQRDENLPRVLSLRTRSVPDSNRPYTRE
jgi:hypothetical protein